MIILIDFNRISIFNKINTFSSYYLSTIRQLINEIFALKNEKFVYINLVVIGIVDNN